MSRNCKAQVRGVCEVLLVCDVCERQQWFTVELHGEDPECLEYVAMQQAGWFREDDCYACSTICSAAFWEDI